MKTRHNGGSKLKYSTKYETNIKENPQIVLLEQKYARVSKGVLDWGNRVYGIHIYSFPYT